MAKWRLVIAIAALISLGIFIWPGLYIYGTITATSDVFRVNRITGIKQFSTEKGWKTLDEMAQQAERDRLVQVTRQAEDLAEAARSGKIQSAQFQGHSLVVRFSNQDVESYWAITAREKDIFGAALNKAGVDVAASDAPGPLFGTTPH